LKNEPITIVPGKRSFGRLPIQSADAALGGFVVLVVCLLVVPLPAWLLDLLLSANLAISLLVVLVTLYVTRILDIAAFPTLLLMTTLLRLGLNVASTRLILLDGYAGEVIGAFGQFVVRGNYAVGSIVFFVLCIIQYVVIAKGSERVAEVGARFVLDAMPGKQMAIDAELRAGSIDNATARLKRRTLERENQFYGAMDGAMKFVKGDVIAGFIIACVNLLGGVAVGTLQRGLPPYDALKRYGLLAVGDGLVTQIPSIILAVAAGVLVTRVGSESEELSVAQQLAGQLFAVPRAFLVAGMFALLLALVPGLPALPFLAIACFFAAAYSVRQRAFRSGLLPARDTSVNYRPQTQFSPVLVPWAILVGPSYVSGRPDRAGEFPPGVVSALATIVESVRLRVFRELGVQVPPCRFELDPALGEGVLRVAVHEMTMLLCAANASSRAVCEEFEGQLLGILRREACHFVGLVGTQALLDSLELVDGVSVKHVVPKTITLTKLSNVLQRLVEEGVNIRDLGGILMMLGRCSPSESDCFRLTEAVREQLKRQICHRITNGNQTIQVISLDPTLEDMISMGISKDSMAEQLSLSASALRDILSAIVRAADETRGRRSDGAMVVLVAPTIRRHTWQLLRGALPEAVVLSYSELVAELAIETLATASLFGIGADEL